ncbi:hypothetical protein [Endozoicomonas sp. 8E]|uniref:hypothetical protein n=1 Tax=Endozoicomonas sp. 8E TaxID=3035692 RepID=UPI002938D4C5|nr:hypothetical protein [Endozoicomonas sp. 8E]WOG28963.1 hypothetical protein P6910_04680 [Endozoicomonas sp. 8E]
MPLYNVSTPGAVEMSKRQPLSKLIMDTHCCLTSAPESLVNVLFNQNIPLKKGIVIHLQANVRKGRTSDINDRLSLEMQNNIAHFFGIDASGVSVSLFEVPASWVMEGGELLPEPGEEASCEWLQKDLKECEDEKKHAALETMT